MKYWYSMPLAIKLTSIGMVLLYVSIWAGRDLVNIWFWMANWGAYIVGGILVVAGLFKLFFYDSE